MARVWIFHHYAEPPDGHFTASYELARQLAQRGHSVTVFASGFSHYSRTETRVPPGRLIATARFDGVEFVFVRTLAYHRNDWRRALNMLTYVPAVFLAGWRRPDTPDVVIGSTPHPFAALAGYVQSRLRRAAFVFEVLDLWPQFQVELGALPERGVVTAVLRWCERYGFRKADKIVTLWPGMSTYIAERGIATEKVVWIPLAVDPQHHLATDLLGRPEDGSFVVMYRGGFGHSNDVELILDAALVLQNRNCRSIRIVLAGEGTGRDRLLARAQELELTNVEFRGFVPRSEFARQLAEADAFVCTLPDLPHFRKYGQIQTKLLDYLAAGRPTVLATNVPVNLVSEADAGVVVPAGDAEGLAEAFLRLAGMTREERARLGANGRRYVAENHDINEMGARLHAIVMELTGRDRPASARSVRVRQPNSA